MARGQFSSVLLVLSLVTNAFSVPASPYRPRGYRENLIDSSEVTTGGANVSHREDKVNTSVTTDADEKSDDDDFDFDFDSPPPSSGGGSNIVSLLNIANALFPASSGRNDINKFQRQVRNLIRSYMSQMQRNLPQRRHYVVNNDIDVDYTTSKSLLQRHVDTSRANTLSKMTKVSESDKKVIESYNLSESKGKLSETDSQASHESETSESEDETPESNSDASESNNVSDNKSGTHSDENNGAEESAEQLSNESNSDSHSKQDSSSNASNASDDNDSDYDEPEGDGEGGGILGLLAGLSGDGESDLGTLLATVGGIIANLSGDGVDINSLIASGLGLLVGLLSDGNQNPGEILAGYLLASLESLTEGGAKNNGAFFGKFVSTLIKGVSAAEVEDGSNENAQPMKDSVGFYYSLIMGLLGDMSKTSSGGSSKTWR